ncbi:hypothetical protein ScPMuIL_003011 [Solemya velum]
MTPKSSDICSEDTVNQSLILILTGCTDTVEIIGLMAASWDIPIITPVASGPALANKIRYNTLTRLSADFTKYANFYVKVLNSFNWTDLTFITDNTHITMHEIPEAFIPIFKEKGIRARTVHYDRGFGDEQVLKEASKTARVFVVINFPHKIRPLIKTAIRLGMTTGDYAFLVFRIAANYEGVGDQRKPFTDEYDTDEMRKAYEVVMLTDWTRGSGPVYDAFDDYVRNVSLVKYNYSFGEKKIGRAIEEYYNAFSMMGNALNQTMLAGGDIFNGRDVMKYMWNQTFFGLSRMVAIDEKGDRDGDFSLFDFKENGKLVEVANYRGHTKKFQAVPGTTIDWPGGGDPPPNTPYCGFLNDEPRCHPSGKALDCLLYVTKCISFLYRKMKLEADLMNQWWKVRWEDITMDGIMRTMSKSMSSSQFLDTSSQVARLSSSVGIYQGVPVAIKKLKIKNLQLERNSLLELKQMRDIHCTNLTKFVGLCVDEGHFAILMEYAPRGSLDDILQNDSIKMDKAFKVSLLSDIVQGMIFIHHGQVVKHGRLHSGNCVIDSRFVLKITDFGLFSVRKLDMPVKENEKLRLLFWIAPEHLRTNPCLDYSQHGDVYSFAIVLYEILTRLEPYPDEEIESIEDVLMKLKAGGPALVRPRTDFPNLDISIVNLMKECWHEDPTKRPSFRHIKKHLKDNKWMTTGENFVDTMLKRMEQYANNLEGLVEERTRAFLDEKRKAEELLYHILPKTVADRLKNGVRVDPEAFDSVTIYFSDIVGFTSISADSTPMEVVDLLNDLYTCFDNIIDHHDVYKVETIGDAYMVVSGLPVRNGIEHAGEIARLSLAILENIVHFRMRHKPETQLRARIGLHSGPVCAGVVGQKMPRYCLFGDTVNTASRMESNGEGD